MKTGCSACTNQAAVGVIRDAQMFRASDPFSAVCLVCLLDLVRDLEPGETLAINKIRMET